MRKILVPLIAVVLMVSMLIGGCTKEEATTATSPTASSAPTVVEKEKLYTNILNPLAQLKTEWNIQPLVERPSTLEGKTVYIVNTRWHGAEEQEPFLLALKAKLEEMVPNINVVYKLKLGAYMYNDEQLWKEIADNGDAALVGVGH